MTLVNFHSFDNLTDTLYQNNYTNVSANLIETNITDRFGNANGAIQVGSEFNSTALDLPDFNRTNTPFIIGFAAKHPVSNHHLDIRFSDIGGTTYVLVWFFITQYGTVRIQKRNTTTSDTVIVADVPISTKQLWHYYEIELYAHSTGYCNVWVDGVQVIADSDNYYHSYNASNYHEDGYIANARFTGDWYLDDLYLILKDATSPNTVLGDVHVESLYPSANGTTNNGTASAGSNYECVDEAQPNDDTDYVTLDAVDEIELYTMDNLSVTDGTIHAVKSRNCIKKTSVGSRSIQGIVRISSTNYTTGTDWSVLADYTFQNGTEQLWIDNPDDSQAWAVADVNGMESGIKVTA